MQIYSWMDTLVAQYPDLVTKQSIGQSYENRPMYVLKVRYFGYTTACVCACLRVFQLCKERGLIQRRLKV